MRIRLFAFAAALGVLMLPGAVPAQDLGPVIIGGEQPWQSFTGTISASQSLDLFTVPADRAFILTGGCVQNGTNAQEIDLMQSSSLKVDGSTTILLCNPGSGATSMFAAGRAHVLFPAGSVVQLQSAASLSFSAAYFFEGYLAHP
jgi:hypothetical protein